MVFVILCFIIANAMKCYQCRSDVDGHCENSIDESYLIDCIPPHRLTTSTTLTTPAPNQTSTSSTTSTKPPQLRSDDDVLCRKISQNCMLYFISMIMRIMNTTILYSSLKYTKRSIMYAKVGQNAFLDKYIPYTYQKEISQNYIIIIKIFSVLNSSYSRKIL